MMTAFQSLLLIATISLLAGIGGASFPENRIPISITAAEDVPSSFFTGGSSVSDSLVFTQDLKMIRIAGREYFAVTGRETLFLVRPQDFSPSAARKIPYTEVFTWKTDEKARTLCVQKGQTEENCESYIRVLEQMNDNGDKLLVCATNSYNPQCMYLTASTKNNELILSVDGERFSGVEKCAFGPDQTGVSLYTGNSLYSATASDFGGRSHAIARSLGEQKQLRTPKFDYLQTPSFVKMIDDGERVLVFMNERVRTAVGDVRMVAYVAQVCKNDVGGKHVLVRQWTKFEKTRLNCSRNGFYFDRLQGVSEPMDVQTTKGDGTTEKTIYATFTTPEFSVPGSAVCAFTVDSIHKALLGRFREERGSVGSKSSAPSGRKHPGKCPSQPYTESELLFLKSHPLLEDQARGSLLTTHVGERWTSVAVDSTAGPSKNWTVFFVGTTEGQLLRYLAPTGGLKNAVFLRRQDVYDSKRCGNATEENISVKRVVADPERNQILITFKHCVMSIPLRSCSVHKCKKSCLASADPYCGWNGTDCVGHLAPSVNIEQYVYSEAAHPSTDIETLCPKAETFPVDDEKSESGQATIAAEKENAPSGSVEGKEKGPDSNFTAGSFVDEGADEDGQTTGRTGAVEAAESVYIEWHIVVVIAICTGLLFFVAGIVVSKKCCTPTEKDIEKRPEGMDASKSNETLCKKFVAALSPKTSRKDPQKTAAPGRQPTPATDSQAKPLVSKVRNESDEYVRSYHGTSANHQVSNPKTLPAPERSSRSRLHSASTASQVTVAESLGSCGTNNRHSSSYAASSLPKGRPSYATAPRGRYFSGNRTSDPSEYTNAPTLRADRAATHMSSRHSTPVPIMPLTPTSVNSGAVFTFSPPKRDVLDRVDNVLEKVSAMRCSRESAEMAPVLEEHEDARLRHVSNDSGKGSSAPNSVESEDHDKVATLSRSNPEGVQTGQRKGRKRLNSEPTSPTPTRPLPPPSSHEPVNRSNPVRYHHSMSVPHHQSPRKRSESLSHHQPQQVSPPRKGQPLKMHQMVQNGFHPHAKPNVYEAFPAPLQPSIDAHSPVEKYHRQESYDTFAPHGRHQRYDHPAMNMPDRYSSLPLRSQAHRSNKKPYPPQYSVLHPAQTPHRNGGAPQKPPPSFHKQMSSPATFDPQRGQRPRYVPGPTVPGIAAPLLEQDAV